MTQFSDDREPDVSDLYPDPYLEHDGDVGESLDLDSDDGDDLYER